MYLQNTLSGDNSLIKSSSAYLRVFLKSEASLTLLLPLLQKHDSPHIRQLAAVLLKKKLMHHY